MRFCHKRREQNYKLVVSRHHNCLTRLKDESDLLIMRYPTMRAQALSFASSLKHAVHVCEPRAQNVAICSVSVPRSSCRDLSPPEFDVSHLIIYILKCSETKKSHVLLVVNGRLHRCYVRCWPHRQIASAPTRFRSTATCVPAIAGQRLCCSIQ